MNDDNNLVYVIGHRNPDADAICSAIGYAAYKHELGETAVIPARCGNSNARIDAILGEFGVPLPTFVGDVTPRVKDIMTTELLKVTPNSICTEALDIMDKYDLRILPVVDDEGRLEGSLSIFDLGEYFIPKPREERKMRYVFTTLHNIIRALNAEVVHTVDEHKAQDFFVRIGAMDIRSFGSYYKSDQEISKKSIIIVGDRYDIQQRSIQSGVRILVISGGLPVEPDVVELAKERGVSIIKSPHDSATTSWIIRSAGRVESVVNPETLNFHPNDKLALAQRIMARSNATACMVVDDEKRLLGVFTNSDVLKPLRTKLILVDHNELGQAVSGADQVEIVEIVDHHRLGNPPTHQPISFINLPVGSTSTIVADLFRKQGLTPDPKIAGVLMGGIISDTLFLKGPTTTAIDRELLSWLEEVSGKPAKELAEKIFNAGSIIKTQDLEEVIRADMKLYNEGSIRFSVSQVEELGFDNFLEHREELDEALESFRAKEDLYFSALLVTDINRQNSLLVIRGDRLVLEQIRYPYKSAEGSFDLKGIVSRKKQLIPYLTTLVRQHIQA